MGSQMSAQKNLFQWNTRSPSIGLTGINEQTLARRFIENPAAPIIARYPPKGNNKKEMPAKRRLISGPASVTITS